MAETPLPSQAFAVIVAVPSPMALIKPLASTTATFWLLDVHSKMSAIVASLGVIVAVSCFEPPGVREISSNVPVDYTPIKYVKKPAGAKAGMVIYTTNDSVNNLVKEALKDVAPDSVVAKLKKQFKRDVRIERLLVEKGENAIVDELVFDGPKATPKDKRYTRYFMYEGKVIAQPEEAADVRGQVTSDYQAVLEDEWVKSLKSKYPVVVNQKVLKMVK